MIEDGVLFVKSSVVVSAEFVVITSVIISKLRGNRKFLTSVFTREGGVSSNARKPIMIVRGIPGCRQLSKYKEPALQWRYVDRESIWWGTSSSYSEMFLIIFIIWHFFGF